MKMSTDDIARYPKFHNYIKNDIPKLISCESDKRPTMAGSLVHVTGVTVLHELTHWAEDKRKKPQFLHM